ncbi:MAG: molybdopterin-dependent oxidoreductase [Candidatus Lokiarchaeota archaeon]
MLSKCIQLINIQKPNLKIKHFIMKNQRDHNNNVRLPPGQHLTSRFPVLQHGRVTHVDRENYTLEIDGEIEQPITFTLAELEKLNDVEIVDDIHCVTSWSKFDTKWGGISFKKHFDAVKPKSTALFVEFLCADGGFTTTVPVERLRAENAILALNYEGEPINDKHGGPVRAVIPDLYFYKSAKWVIKITFLKEDRLGYWERGGYSNKADPWKQQRYSYQD